MHDVGLYGVETCRGQRYRYQTPLNLLIYKRSFGNSERGTDSVCSLLSGNAPLIQDAHLKAEEAGYRVLGVAVQDSRGALRSLSESMGLSFPMVLDGDNGVGIAYHVVGPPSTFFIDANGKIISVVAGQIEEDTLEQELAKLLG